MDFDANSSDISNVRDIPITPMGNSSNLYAGVVDVEWSADGTKLYVSKYRGFSPLIGGKLFQYELNNPSQSVQLLHQISNTNSHVEIYYTDACSVDVNIFVEVPEQPIPEFIFPNVFTPNNDSDNDTYKLFPTLGDCFELIDFKIYNPWGNLLFETKDEDFVWTGKLSNG